MISLIGRRQWKSRLLIWSIYIVLSAGVVTMVYPFLLMLGGSTKTSLDAAEVTVMPRYLVNETALYRKYLEGFFNERSEAMQNAYGLWDATFLKVSLPGESSPLIADWQSFVADREKSENVAWFVLAYLQCPVSKNAVPFNLSKLRTELLRENGSIEAVNLKYQTSFPNVSAFYVVPANFLNRFVTSAATPFAQRVEEFSLAQPVMWRAYVDLSNFFRSYLRGEYGASIAALNGALGTSFGSWSDVPLEATRAEMPPALHKDYEAFVRNVLNPVFLQVDSGRALEFRSYLKAKYRGDIAAFNERRGTAVTSFEEVVFPTTRPRQSIEKTDWDGFLEGWTDDATGSRYQLPIEGIRLTGPDFAFREYLGQRYGSLARMNEMLGTAHSTWGVVAMPQQAAQFVDFQKMQGWLKWYFTTRNYIDVWNYLVVNGRGFFNTLIFCALSILAALTVDPIAAYALSRFKPRSTYKVLLFLMMTMAFPAMVTQIPMFLLLRELGMLNTFWALILPGLANGYHIFLLKGFFDSLPRELYESAAIDGASEPTIFFNITMALSKPILAVIALGAFTHAYAAFMFALLICQDPKMWTLMVWLFQLQQTSGQGIVYAALIVAAIPTLLVFVFCQNIIMRGIVVPVEK
ncbi:multiple sugar transport system permease protein [Terrimicrobium sacchariphilum]|uniref:sn-glycerol-3-phosphate transport system permease protein UgpE n=1 Tax=Terrimicrobium sacchariphilum TaxID=690879 RepID=A0A146GDI9_TERSA|nr:carbohydrate ABC transporter permease [Terrimicrobium sacchariphilum]GAT35223.1 multiple sugar transport system permease protein [Terrimicrobium sacchariphilum]